MDQEFRDDRSRGKWVIALGVVLAIVAGGAAFFLINQAQQQVGQANAQKVPAVVAVQVIPAREAIDAADVEVRQVPLDPTNANGVIADPAEVIGRIPAVSILQGQLITTNMLASSDEGGQFSVLGPDETIAPDSELWRAVSLTVSDDMAVGGLLKAGQSVDVFVTVVVSVPADLAAAGRFYADRATKVTYQDMVILARSGAFYIVRAPLDVAEEIAHLQATGNATFGLALRPDEDTRTTDASAFGETTNRIIEKYGVPVPEVFPAGRGPLQTPVPLTTPAPSPSPSLTPISSPGASAAPAPSATPAP
jgi:Flp pilus assembly protein CpaB